MKLSIIIPVYNADQYLRKSLESVFNQKLDLREFEVICINDGSTDNTGQILDEFHEKYGNIIIVSQENQGEAVSRNIALKLSKGKFITFLDSDDYYDDEALMYALKIIDEKNLDILYLKINHISEDYTLIDSLPNLSNEELLPGFKHDRRPFPATIYKREIIGDIEFPLNIIVGPDSVFNALVQSRAERVFFSQDSKYNYLLRSNSLSKKAFTEEGYEGFINAIRILDEYKKEHFSTSHADAQDYFDKVILVFLTRIVELHILPNLYRPKYREIKKLLTDLGYWHLAKRISEQYPYFDVSFSKFVRHQKKLLFKTRVYQFIQKIKKL